MGSTAPIGHRRRAAAQRSGNHARDRRRRAYRRSGWPGRRPHAVDRGRDNLHRRGGRQLLADRRTAIRRRLEVPAHSRCEPQRGPQRSSARNATGDSSRAGPSAAIDFGVRIGDRRAAVTRRGTGGVHDLRRPAERQLLEDRPGRVRQRAVPLCVAGGQRHRGGQPPPGHGADNSAQARPCRRYRRDGHCNRAG